MVTVPGKTVRSVPVRPAPTVFQRFDTAGAFGGQEARAIQGLGAAAQQVGGQISDFALKQQIEDNERERKQLDIEASSSIREIRNKFRQLKGQNAVDAEAATQEEISKSLKDISSRASNTAVSNDFNQVAAVRAEREFNNMGTFVQSQRQVANTAANKARLNEFVDDAATHAFEPEALLTDLMGLRAEAEAQAMDEGLDEASVKSAVEDAETVFHETVIDRMLSEQDYNTALEYFNTNLDNIDGRRQAVIRESIERKGATHIAKLRKSVDDNIKVLDSGALPENIGEVKILLANTPGEKARLLEVKLEEAITDRAAVFDHIREPLADQRASINTLEQLQIKTPAQVRQLARFKKSTAAQSIEIGKGNGIQVAANVGHIEPLIPVNFSNAANLAERKAQSEVATAALGTFISPLTDAETDQLKATLGGEPGTGQGAASPDQSVNTLASVVNAFGEDGAARIAGDLARKDAPELAMSMLIVGDRPELSRDIAQGGKHLRDPAFPKLKPTSDDKKAAIETVIGNMFGKDSAGALGPILASTDALYAARIVPTGSLEFDGVLYERALADVLGGSFEYKDRRIIAPIPGFTESQTENVIDGMTQDDFVSVDGELPVFADGTVISVEALKDRFFSIGNGAQLVSTDSNGRYSLEFSGGVPVLDNTGQLFILDLRDIIERGGGPQATPSELSPELELQRGLIEEETGRDIETGRSTIEGGGVDELLRMVVAPTLLAERFRINENAQRAGRDAETGLWQPHKSVESGARTIGFGHKLDKGEAAGQHVVLDGRKISFKKGLTDEQVNALLKQDIIEATDIARDLVSNFDDLTPARQAVVTDLAFNLGRSGFSKFKKGTIALIEAGEWEKAAASLLQNKRMPQERLHRNAEDLLRG